MTEASVFLNDAYGVKLTGKRLPNMVAGAIAYKGDWIAEAIIKATNNPGYVYRFPDGSCAIVQCDGRFAMPYKV